ncbi:MAG: leucyl/phenylalanyl-tRNA--protein transferase [Planctomycetes bacterium]|nr:leucyl/phenylalanyl-tRNA--protein transferase [Planctomycetota bacterium]
MRDDLSPEVLLAAYVTGIFPMADEAGEVHWLAPDPRAIIELDGFTVSRSLRAVIRREGFEMTVNQAFPDVIEACADRVEGTWISPEIKEAYGVLHDLGFCHSVEVWQDGWLAGGLYGVAIGGAFFGESMFHRISDASKVALVHLVSRMRERGFTLLDVQFMTEHLRQFGAVEIPRIDYERRLGEAVRKPCSFVEGAGGTLFGEETRRSDASPGA